MIIMVHRATNQSALDMGMGMSDFFYGQWYVEDVSPNLSKAQKEKLLHKISDWTLENPIGVGVEVDKKDFPELAPFMHTEKLSSLQLVSVMKGLFKELRPKQAKAIDV